MIVSVIVWYCFIRNSVWTNTFRWMRWGDSIRIRSLLFQQFLEWWNARAQKKEANFKVHTKYWIALIVVLVFGIDFGWYFGFIGLAMSSGADRLKCTVFVCVFFLYECKHLTKISLFCTRNSMEWEQQQQKTMCFQPSIQKILCLSIGNGHRALVCLRFLCLCLGALLFVRVVFAWNYSALCVFIFVTYFFLSLSHFNCFK